MSANPDEAGALSPAERDFALRRMPVETFREAGRDAFGMPQSLAEAYHAANVAPVPINPQLVADVCAVISEMRDALDFAACVLSDLPSTNRAGTQTRAAYFRIKSAIARAEALK